MKIGKPSPAVAIEGAPLRFGSKSFYIIIFILILIWSYYGSEADFIKLLGTEGRGDIYDFVEEGIPPDLSISFLKKTIKPTLDTLQMSIFGTFLAIVFALPLSILATRTLTFSGILYEMESPSRLSRLLRFLPYIISRTILNVFRAIPDIVWALIFIVAVGLGPFPGVLAIAIYTAGIYGKLYSETMEAVDPRPIEAIQSTGANKIQIVLYGVLPQAIPQLISYTLYRWECNIRAATILGFVGAGGIGEMLIVTMTIFEYQKVLTIIGIILLIVTAVDYFSAFIRKRII